MMSFRTKNRDRSAVSAGAVKNDTGGLINERFEAGLPMTHTEAPVSLGIPNEEVTVDP
jgi:hypothetical protein